MTRTPARPFRSREWFAAPGRSDMAALYLERFMNYGITPDELRSGRPIVGIAQTGSDLNPCNRIHLELAKRVREGIRDAGGVAMEFPVFSIFENCRRPTAAIDRNLAYLTLVETLNGVLSEDYVADLKKAREVLLVQRRTLAKSLGNPDNKDASKDRESFVEIQCVIDGIDKAIEDEEIAEESHFSM